MQRTSLADMMINDCYASNAMFGSDPKKLDMANLVANGAAAGAAPKYLVTAFKAFLLIIYDLN